MTTADRQILTLAAALTLVGCGPRRAESKRSATFGLTNSSAPVVCAGGPTLTGIDVSHYQSTVDWSTVAGAGTAFAFVKATEGLNTTDAQFSNNWSGMQQNGVVRGAYHFFHASDDGTQQADFFLSVLGQLQPGDLRPAVDVEVTDNESTATVASQLTAFLTEIKAQTGVDAIVYTDPSLGIQIGDPAQLSNNPLWLANYGVSCPSVPNTWPSWQVWQNSSGGSIQGVNGAVDLDLFNGTTDDLQSLTVGGGTVATGQVGGVLPPSPAACVPDGDSSNTGDGTDCCSGNYDYSTDLCGQPACIQDGQQSAAGDGSDCCSGNYDPNTNLCGLPPPCIQDGQQSVTGDGTDCCSDEWSSSNNVCGPTACIPDGQQSALGDGFDCCSISWDVATNLCGCVPTGDPTQTTDGSDCCSGNLGSSTGVCG